MAFGYRPADEWSAAVDVSTVHLETRPTDPYSINLWGAGIGKDFYVSTKGKGKKATKEKPAKDLGNIIKKLSPGDTVHIASGTYLGRGKNGSNVILVPVSIIGGYDETFTKRDPWGATKTIFSGDNLSKNYVATAGLMIDLMKYKDDAIHPILVDGIIVDHGARNRYKTAEQHMITMLANPKTGEMPTPSLGGLVVRVSKAGLPE